MILSQKTFSSVVGCVANTHHDVPKTVVEFNEDSRQNS